MTRNGFRLSAAVGFACAVLAVPPAFEHYRSVLARTAVKRALVGLPDLTVGAVAVDSLRDRVSLEHVEFVRPGLLITLGRVDIPVPGMSLASIVGPALAQSGTATAQNISIVTPMAVITIPRVEARGTALSGPELAALFDPKDGPSLADRLAKLSFDTLSAPEVTIAPAAAATDKGDQKGLTLHNVALSQGVAGKIKGVLVERADLDEARGGTPAGSIETGKISLSNVDLPLLLRIKTGTRGSAEEPLLPVYDGFSIDAIRLRSPSSGDVEIGSVRGLNFKGRPPLVSFAELSPILDKPAAERSEGERHQLAAYLADALSSFSSERLELRDFGFSEIKGGEPVTLKLGGFTIDGFQGTKLRSVALTDFSMATTAASVSFARAALDGFQEPGLPDFIERQAASPDASPSGADFKTLGLMLADASLQGLHVDVPMKDGSGNSADGGRALIEVPEFEVRIPNAGPGVPADLAMHMRTTYDIAPSAPADAMQALVKAGFGHFDVSTDYSMTWDKKAEIATIDRFSINAKDMASVTFGTSVSNVTEDLFSGDTPSMQRAAQLVRLRSLDIGLTNAGLAEKAMPLVAAASNTSVALLKAELIGQIDVAIIQALGTGPVTDQLTGAVTAFINDPKNLTLSIKAPAGLDIEALNAAKDPKDLLGLVEVSATANR